MKVTVKRVCPIMYKHPQLQAEYEAFFNLTQDNAALRKKLIAAEADVAFWKKAASENAELAANSLRDATMAQNTVNKLEGQLEEANAELAMHELGHYKRDCEEWKATADELAEKCACYKQERDIARDEANELRIELDNLNDDYDALVQTKRDYGEEIDRLRKLVTEMQTNRFTLDEIFSKLLVFAEGVVPSTDK